MTKAIAFLLASLFVITSFAQTFEGEITYKNAYKSKIPNLTDQQLLIMLGATQDYFIKGGNYKSVTNGSFMQWQLYNNKDNKLYTKTSSSEKILWKDGAINTDVIIKSELSRKATTILGHTCDELVLTCKSGIQKYYFNSAYSVDTKLYIHHKFGNWYDYLLKASALPLKTIFETPQFTFESVAITIKATTLDKKIFELPDGIETMKSPF